MRCKEIGYTSTEPKVKISKFFDKLMSLRKWDEGARGGKRVWHGTRESWRNHDDGFIARDRGVVVIHSYLSLYRFSRYVYSRYFRSIYPG